MTAIPRYPRVVVLGAGTMGAQLACHLAGNGPRVDLLDLDTAIAAEGLRRTTALRPSPLYVSTDSQNIRTGSFDEIQRAVGDADWVIEAVVERVEPKQELLARVDEALNTREAWPVISTNTSGLSVHRLADGRSSRFKEHFLGTHFFNPPRYTRLLELVPLAETHPSVVDGLEDFASRRLGKGTVIARDTPAFIANRLGVHAMLVALRLAHELGIGPDEVDDLTGQLIGRPKSATFRTLDLVGIDVAVAVADHCREELADDPRRAEFEVPPVLRSLVEHGSLGEKSGRGFYRREDGEILALDLETGEYRPRQHVRSAAVEMARNEDDLGRRLTQLLRGTDAAGDFLRRAFRESLSYAAAVGAEIAEDAATVDAAMRWGFGWQLGPFQLIDALPDVREDVLAVVPEMPTAYYTDGCTWDFTAQEQRPVEPRRGSLDLHAARKRARAAGMPSNAAATIVELPDRILGLELHGKLNIIGLDTIAIARQALDRAIAACDGLVIGTEAPDFGAGANLALLLIEAEEGEWGEIDRVVRAFQDLNGQIRAAPIPVVVAARGRTLGGAAEIALHAARVQALHETYIGLVETSVGIVPAGGGSTAMARRAAERLPEGARGDLFPIFQHVFTTIASARVATSAADASELLFLRESDPVTADPDRQWLDAVGTARGLADAGYRPPPQVRIPVLGRRGIAAAEALTYNQLVARNISEHDRTVALELARVMSGGDVAEGTAVSEDYLLGLEREAFLRLLGEAKTRERIKYTLKTGKPLRN